MKRCLGGIVLIMSALCGMDHIARNPFAPFALAENELVATAYIQSSNTTINFMTRGKNFTAVPVRHSAGKNNCGKKPLQLYTS